MQNKELHQSHYGKIKKRGILETGCDINRRPLDKTQGQTSSESSQSDPVKRIELPF